MIIGIGMVKNEADIIEAFVRHNLHFVDELWLIENGSLDPTPSILDLLKAHQHKVTVIKDHSFGYNQSEKITALYKRVLLERKPDFVIPLDADEFIQAVSKDVLRQQLSAIRPGQIGRWLWRTHVPTDTSTDHIPTRFAKARRHEMVRHGKIVIRCNGRHDDDAVIAQGYHSMTRAGKPLRPVPLQGPVLAHIPVRSTHQLAQKAILGWMANVAHFKTRGPACGFHWGDLYARALQLTDADLLHEAYNYSELEQRNDYDLTPKPLQILGYERLNLAIPNGINHKVLLDLVCRTWEASLLEL